MTNGILRLDSAGAILNTTGEFGNRSASVSATMAVLVGHTCGEGIVNSGDATQTRTRSGQDVITTTFRADPNRDGIINSADALIVRSRSGSSIPGAMAGPERIR